MSIKVSFGCGHSAVVPATISAAPMCPTCGDRRVQRVTTRPPTFRGTCTGPFAETKALDAIPVNLAPQGSLNLKSQES